MSCLTSRLNNYDLRQLEKIKKSQNFTEVQRSAESSFQSENFFNINIERKKTPEKQKLNFSRNALFHIKTRACLKNLDPEKHET